MSPAPFLVKKRVVLTDVVQLQGDSQGGSFYGAATPNGANTLNFTGLIPQVAIWDQFASIYEFYQVKHIGFKFVPYRFQGSALNQTKIETVFNTLSIQSPGDQVPVVNGAFSDNAMFSFGNCKIEQGYNTHSRSMSDYTNLGLQKQNEIILKTNGAHAVRQQYVKPASMFLTGRGTSFDTTIMGDFVYSITYEFSGMQSPLITGPQPIVQIPQSLTWVNNSTLQPQAPAGDETPPDSNAIMVTRLTEQLLALTTKQ